MGKEDEEGEMEGRGSINEKMRKDLGGGSENVSFRHLTCYFYAVVSHVENALRKKVVRPMRTPFPPRPSSSIS